MQDSEDTAQDVAQEEIEQEESSTSEDVETEESESEQEGESEESTDDESQKPKKTAYQRRVDQLTWKLREAERQLEAERQAKQPPKPESQKPVEFPTLESVGYDEGKYQEAVARYYEAQVDQTLSNREQQKAEEQRNQELHSKVGEFHAKGMALADDYEELVIKNPALPVTEAMRDALLATEKGPEVLYHLASHPDEIFRIANLSPYAQAVEIGRLEARMSIPKPKKTSSAPSPIKPLSAGGESVSKDPDEMTVKEWREWRRKNRNR